MESSNPAETENNDAVKIAERDASWQDWIIKQNKIYSTEEEKQIRYKIFCDNYDQIEKHNKENHSWKMGLNDFADLSPEEFKQKFCGGLLKK